MIFPVINYSQKFCRFAIDLFHEISLPGVSETNGSRVPTIGMSAGQFYRDGCWSCVGHKSAFDDGLVFVVMMLSHGDHGTCVHFLGLGGIRHPHGAVYDESMTGISAHVGDSRLFPRGL